MKKQILGVLFLLMIPVFIFAENDPKDDKKEDKNKKFGIKFTGFVKADIFWDSRQTISVREGHFLLYPANEDLDENGEDLNAVPNFNMLTIQTRLKGIITGPDVGKAKTSGVIEGEFFGHSNGDINGFRLRHAFVKLDWKKSMLLVGQFWNPMFITSCYPGTVSFNTGVPFVPFSRNPQIRYMFRAGGFHAIGTIYSQVDFKSNGPDGANPKYIRNTAIPAANIRLEYSIHNVERNFDFLIGAALNYKTLKPRLETESMLEIDPAPVYKSDETISSLAYTIYLKIKSKPITFKAQATYGQDVFDFTMIGGYAEEMLVDPNTGAMTYTNINTYAAWADIHTNGTKWQAGILMGYSQNLGSDKKIEGAYYSRGNNIGYAYRFSPRFIYNIGKFRIAPEVEYTVAGYGTTDEKGVVEDIKNIGNVRFLLGVYFFF